MITTVLIIVLIITIVALLVIITIRFRILTIIATITLVFIAGALTGALTRLPGCFGKRLPSTLNLNRSEEGGRWMALWDNLGGFRV